MKYIRAGGGGLTVFLVNVDQGTERLLSAGQVISTLKEKQISRALALHGNNFMLRQEWGMGVAYPWGIKFDPGFSFDKCG